MITHRIAQAGNVLPNGTCQVVVAWLSDGKEVHTQTVTYTDDPDLKAQMRQTQQRLSAGDQAKVTLPKVGAVIDLSVPPVDPAVVARDAFRVKLRTYQGKKAAVALALEAAKAETDAKAALSAAPNPYLPGYSDDLIGVV